MNRFKFRVWKQDNYGYNIKNEFVKQKPHYEYFELNNNVLFMKTDIIEQCTGLKDKNDKFIYENDLIKISGFDRIFQVVWLEEPACWGLKHQKDTSALCFVQGVEKEIIGNIHENPELLEDK